MTQANVYDKLKELGIELPTAGAPAAAYVMRQHGVPVGPHCQEGR
jgi:hypothetical protein